MIKIIGNIMVKIYWKHEAKSIIYPLYEAIKVTQAKQSTHWNAGLGTFFREFNACSLELLRPIFCDESIKSHACTDFNVNL